MDGIRTEKTISGVKHSYITQNGKVMRETIGTGSTAKVLDFIYDNQGRPLALKYSTNGGSSFNTYYYDMIAEKQAENEQNGETRKTLVMFMSDGAPFQYNYFGSESEDINWNHWLQGTVDKTQSYWTNSPSSHKEQYYNEEGRHWMAEAIKGDPELLYKVIRTDAPAEDDYITHVPGLNAEIYSLGFCLADDQQITTVSMESVLYKIASQANETRCNFVNTAEEFGTAFEEFGNEARKAGANAYFTDQMGHDFELQLASYVTRFSDSTRIDLNTPPTIAVKIYDLYTVDEVTENDLDVSLVGTRQSETPKEILETVSFNNDGTLAYSDRIDNGTTQIMTGGVIYAQTFWYNTTSTTRQIVLNDGSKYQLPPKSFYWKVGDIPNDELVLEYFVYLRGSMEGTRAAGSYLTNSYADLHYINYLGHEAVQQTVSPKLPWESATISYAFYLVDANGQPVVNRTTGQTGSFANRVNMTNPVEFCEIPLNNASMVFPEVCASEVIPRGYRLYDEDARYHIAIHSDATGIWTIDKGADKQPTTYVTDYGGTPTTQLNMTGTDVDYTHTVVWFGILYEYSAIPDEVVIDYGLSVDINVLANDIFGQNATLVGVGAAGPNAVYTNALSSGFNPAYTGNYGIAEISGSKVRYTPNTMQMDSVEEFYYAVRHTDENGTKYFYNTVTVIPATTIYYEDSFVTFAGDWVTEGTTDSAAHQDEDRPGINNISQIDANSVYGYDSAYIDYETYSLGSAKKTTVSSGMTAWPTASFRFTGTGFDIISVTSGETGTIMVEVNQNGSNIARWVVDTYYGYDPSGSLTVSDNGALYQVPVLKSPELAYGTYDVVIKPMYSAFFQHKEAATGYDFYLDSIRIYNPAQGNEEAEAAYLKDKEGFPQYIELRNKLIGQNGFGSSGEVAGAVFIDNYGMGGTIDNYTNFGPNNEIYLADGQSVAFNIRATDASKIAAIRLGTKCVNGDIKLTLNGKERSITTASDLFYDITPLVEWTGNDSKTIIITNTGANIISLTNIKITYKEDPAAPNAKMFMTESGAKLAAQKIYNLHVEADSFESEETALSIRSAALVLNGKIDIQYTAQIPEGYENAKMVFTCAGAETTVTDYEIVDGKYRFIFAGITPQHMGENISATLYATKDGEEESFCVPNYSVRQYCVNKLADDGISAELRALLSDLLAYGAAAQNYTGYQTDALVNEGSDLVAPTYSSFSELTGRKASFSGTADANTYWQSAGLTLNNSVAMNFRFHAGSTEGLTVVVTVNGTTYSFDANDFVQVDEEKNIYEVSFTGICANEFDDIVTASFIKDGVQVGNLVSYTVNTYIQSMQHTDNEKLQALVRALYNYGASAAAYTKK